MPSLAGRQRAQATIIFQTIQDSPPLQDILTIATSANQKSFFIAKLLIALPDAFSDRTETPPQLFDIMATWFGKLEDASSRFDAVATAIKHRKQYFTDHRNKKVDFIHRIGLNWSSATRDLFLKGVKTVYLRKRQTPYPPINHWICESEVIDDKWSDYLKYDRRALPDVRGKRPPIFHIDPSLLSLDIGLDDSQVVYDAHTGDLIMLVIRNFSGDPDLLSHIEGIIKQAVMCRRSMRVSHFDKLLPHLFTSASLRILARLFKSVILQGLAISQLSTGSGIFFQIEPQTTPLQYLIAKLHIFFPYFGCSFARSSHKKFQMTLFPGLPLHRFRA
jgi:hypothetical protein